MFWELNYNAQNNAILINRYVTVLTRKLIGMLLIFLHVA